MGLPLSEFAAATARSLVDGQLGLDDAGRDSIDAFDDTGVPPTVFTWSSCRLSVPVRLGIVPRRSEAGRTETLLDPDGSGGALRVRLRYHPADQGVDDPTPALPSLLREHR